jgi:adenylate cyclase
MNKNMLEIERKFLVRAEILEILEKITPIKMKQGYLTKNELGSVRVRIEYFHESLFYSENQIDHAYLMSKTKVDDMSNQETVDEITLENAETLIKNFCKRVIVKYRYIINLSEPDGKKRKWEVDVFESPNPGLVLAELEIQDKEELIWLPPWIDREVTGVPEYYNANM